MGTKFLFEDNENTPSSILREQHNITMAKDKRYGKQPNRKFKGYLPYLV